MTTEQETGRGTPVRRAVPKTSTRRSGQSKPRPRPDERAEPGRTPAGARAEAGGKAGVRERAEGVRSEPGVRSTAGMRSEPGARSAAGVRERGETAGKASVGERVRPEAPGRRGPVRGRMRAETGSGLRVPRRRSGSRSANRQRAPFVLLVVGLLGGGLVSLLLLNTMLARDAITDAGLRKEIEVARQENEQIEQEYQRKTQPNVIAERAEKQGQHPDWKNVNGYSSTGEQTSQADRER
ncbi:hypothetical protein SAMN05444920_105280 [Nonomuraea solani]|uniref:Uncharacterized protein n=1 Tax=Nonomuraea solani TaxID=1144553 RepID=A0A1H6DGY4_9ACTN|nr:hypothetical protein [Nonomuraea solani]SEG83905.1 hypothetical protein SAMN05444920_105280 [Nonomuraea solani]